MMTIMNRDQIINIAAVMAEDTGAPELRNPLNSVMESRSLLDRLLDRISRRQNG
ncbi:MAG: hypothetical protein IJK06_04630 [Clostridia bacterium]|nr:hypothetical protein [Clostridia bacterium]